MTDNNIPDDEPGKATDELNGEDEGFDWPIDRRTLLKGAAAASMAGFVGIPSASGTAIATTGTETLYLSDSATGSIGTILFKVTLDDSTGHADLTELDTWPADHFDQVDALAATPDGRYVYAIDKNSGHLGQYDVVGDSFQDEGALTGSGGETFPGGVVMAAYSPTGTLYIASSATNKIYSVDTAAKTFSEVVTIQQSLKGTDIAFTADGTCYLISTTDGQALYTVDLSNGSVTKKGSGTGHYFTGLGVRDAGTGDIVGSSTTNDTLYLISRDGVLGTGYPLYLDGSRYDYTFGDMTVGALDVCPGETVPLCAGQDIDVGTVTVTEFAGELTITYDLTEPWVMCESHVDIGDAYEDLTTNNSGNPQVGKFDLSTVHDPCVSDYTYTVDCSSDALDDVSGDPTSLVIATHAVVRPADGCADFSSFEPGESVEGMGTVLPGLEIKAGYDEAVAVFEGTDPRIYQAPNPNIDPDQEPVKNWGLGLAKSDGTSNGGFADAKASKDDTAQSFTFTFAEGVTVSEFSLRMMDFGDFNPTNSTSHYAEMRAYDENDDEVDAQVLDYSSNGERVSPVTEEYGDLITNGDAYSTVDDGMTPDLGRYTWTMEGQRITRIELSFGEGYDPDVAFDDLCFTTDAEETAWTCEGTDGVSDFPGHNWATYFTYDLCESAGLLDCKSN